MANVIDSRNDGTIYTKMPSGITNVRLRSVFSRYACAVSKVRNTKSYHQLNQNQIYKHNTTVNSLFQQHSSSILYKFSISQ